MRLLIGTYRRRTHIEECLASVDQHLSGVTDVVFIDDSGDQDHRDWLSQHGKVIAVAPHNAGYGPAMKAVCAAADGEMAMFLEEDFTFTTDVDLESMGELLFHRPYLAQVALLRQAWFPVEVDAGGLIEALEAKGHTFHDVGGLLEHAACFTCNPAVWRGSVFASGWPTGRWSEELKGKQLRSQGYRYGYLPGIRVHHSGERSGHGY